MQFYIWMRKWQVLSIKTNVKECIQFRNNIFIGNNN